MNIENFAFLQNINGDVDFVFASKHNERLAARCVADFIFTALKNSNKKVFLFTGNQKSSLHLNAKNAFLEKCEQYKMSVAGAFDMFDDDSVLKANVNLIGEDVGAVYITSGNSLSLCEYVKNQRKDIVLVCTDTYEELNAYLSDGTIALTVDQNISGQAYKALYGIAMYIIKGQKPEKIHYTDFKFTTKSMLEE